MSQKWLWQSSSIPRRRIEIGLAVRRQGDARHHRAQSMKHEREPCALETGMAREQDALATPKARTGRSRYSQTFHGAFPETQSSSNAFLSRWVSIGCQKPSMLKRHQLPLGGKARKRRALPAGLIALDKLETFRREHKKTAVDHSPIAARLFGKCGDVVAGALQRSETTRRQHRRDRGQLSVPSMKFDRGANIHVADAVTISEAKGIVVLDEFRDALQPPAGLRVFPGVDQRHSPRFDLFSMDQRFVVRHVESDVGHVQRVIGKIFLDEIALVTAADDELIHAIGRIGLHDMPEHRPAADFDQRLGLETGFLGKTSAESTCENNSFQDLPPFLTSARQQSCLRRVAAEKPRPEAVNRPDPREFFREQGGEKFERNRRALAAGAGLVAGRHAVQ